MNEITITINHETAFKNSELESITASIVAASMTARHEVEKYLKKVAVSLNEVDEKNLYKEDGFKSAADYAMETFGYKKSFVYDLLKVGKVFKNLLAEQCDYTVSQLKEMLPLSEEARVSALNSGEINEDMSLREIREKVKEIKPATTRKTKEKTYIWTLVGSDNPPIKATPSEIHNLKFKDFEWYEELKHEDEHYIVGVYKDIPAMWKRVEMPKEEKKGGK